MEKGQGEGRGCGEMMEMGLEHYMQIIKKLLRMLEEGDKE
jgi:hypothetical protein